MCDEISVVSKQENFHLERIGAHEHGDDQQVKAEGRSVNRSQHRSSRLVVSLQSGLQKAADGGLVEYPHVLVF